MGVHDANRFRVSKFKGHFFQVKGSVFPQAFAIAAPAAMLAGVLKELEKRGYLDNLPQMHLVSDSAALGCFQFLVGFLIVFRTSQAYARFWDAYVDTQRMSSEWFDAASSIIAFTCCSKNDAQEVERFQNMIMRMFSMLHAVALQALSDDPDMKLTGFQMVDAQSLDRESLEVVVNSKHKVEVVFQWIQQLMVLNADNRTIATEAAVTSRAFQELATGLCHYHDAMKIPTVPFPFPYTQTTLAMLMMHWLITPVLMIGWTNWAHGAALLTFAQTFVLWSLNAIAAEIQNPFGSDANDIDVHGLQESFNERLCMIVSKESKRLPELQAQTEGDESTRSWKLVRMKTSLLRSRPSRVNSGFSSAWEAADNSNEETGKDDDGEDVFNSLGLDSIHSSVDGADISASTAGAEAGPSYCPPTGIASKDSPIDLEGDDWQTLPQTSAAPSALRPTGPQAKTCNVARSDGFSELMPNPARCVDAVFPSETRTRCSTADSNLAFGMSKVGLVTSSLHSVDLQNDADRLNSNGSCDHSIVSSGSGLGMNDHNSGSSSKYQADDKSQTASIEHQVSSPRHSLPGACGS